MRCTRCGRDDVITIEMRIGAEPVTFHRCNGCEANVWVAPDGEITLEDVLELARAAR